MNRVELIHCHTCLSVVNSYRHAFVWEDNTVDYFWGITGMQHQGRTACGSLGIHPNMLYYNDCWLPPLYNLYAFLCQLPLQSKQPNTITNVVKVKPLNTTSTGQWRLVTCDKGHLTHILLACDVLADCWAGDDVTFSRHSETWASPTSNTCPVPLVGLPLPPSFPCDTLEQRVPYSLVCDHRFDCVDGSDDLYCGHQGCLDNTHFQCFNRQVWYLIW